MRLHLVLVVLVWCLDSVKSCPECPESNWEYDDAWEIYKVAYHKVYYNCTDECNRRVIWEESWKYIEEFNRTSGDKGSSYQISLNRIADRTDEEISNRRYGFVVPPTMASTEPEATYPRIPRMTPPTYLDYTDLGYVTPVKDQGDCANGWAIATTGTIEGQLFKAYGHLIDVSVQQLVDCCKKDKLYDCDGCNGGSMEGAFRCTKDIGGIVTSDVYGLVGMDQECVIPDRRHTRYLCKGYITIAPYNESSLMQHLLAAGPIACAMDVSQRSFFMYASGIYSDPNCPREVNHAVLITGFGTTSDGLDYWIIKNSWGTHWGQNGYFRMIRGSNLCDIAHYCYYPINCKAV